MFNLEVKFNIACENLVIDVTVIVGCHIKYLLRLIIFWQNESLSHKKLIVNWLNSNYPQKMLPTRRASANTSKPPDWMMSKMILMQ